MTHALRTPPVEFAKRGARAGSPPALPEAGSLGSASRDFKVSLPSPRSAPARAFGPYGFHIQPGPAILAHFLGISHALPGAQARAHNCMCCVQPFLHRGAFGALGGACCKHAFCQKGLLRELNPGPLAPEARIIPLDQAADARLLAAAVQL